MPEPTVEARLAVAEWEATAYRNQVAALIREFQRIAADPEGFTRPVDIIVMDGRAPVDEPPAESTAGALAEARQEAENFKGRADALQARVRTMGAELRKIFDLGDAIDGDVLDAARQALDEARNWARHGYEIGQRHCGWSDHGVAPEWLTEGWPRSFDSCKHSKQAAEYDTALSRVHGLPERPEATDAAVRYSEDFLAGYYLATRKAKDAAGPARVATQPDEPDAECSHLCSCGHDQQDHSTSGFCNACGDIGCGNDGHYPSECPHATGEGA